MPDTHELERRQQRDRALVAHDQRGGEIEQRQEAEQDEHEPAARIVAPRGQRQRKEGQGCRADEIAAVEVGRSADIGCHTDPEDDLEVPLRRLDHRVHDARTAEVPDLALRVGDRDQLGKQHGREQEDRDSPGEEPLQKPLHAMDLRARDDEQVGQLHGRDKEDDLDLARCEHERGETDQADHRPPATRPSEGRAIGQPQREREQRRSEPVDVVPEREQRDNPSDEARDGRQPQRVAQEEVDRKAGKEDEQRVGQHVRHERADQEAERHVDADWRQRPLRQQRVPAGQVRIPQERPELLDVRCDRAEPRQVVVEDVVRVLERALAAHERLEDRKRDGGQDRVDDGGPCDDERRQAVESRAASVQRSGLLRSDLRRELRGGFRCRAEASGERGVRQERQ